MTIRAAEPPSELEPKPESIPDTHPYRGRLAKRQQELEHASKDLDRLGNIRLALAALAVVLLLLPLWTRAATTWWILGGMFFVFLWLGRRLDLATDAESRARAARDYFFKELLRVDEGWRGLDDQGVDLAPDHGLSNLRSATINLASDLDVFGTASLFQLINRCQTPSGRESLASWLLEGAGSASEALERQQAVKELAEKIELREALAVAAAGHGTSPLRPDALLRWAKTTKPLPFAGVLAIVSKVQPVILILSGLSLLVGVPPIAFGFVLFAHVILIAFTRAAIRDRAQNLATPDRALMRYADLIEVVEKAELQAPVLQELKKKLQTEGVTASNRIRELRAIVERLEWNSNMFFAGSIGAVSLWELNMILRAEKWHSATADKLGGWFDTLGTFEALASLGAMAFERPDYVMPEIVEEPGVFESQGIEHPLIDRRKVVPNDLSLGGAGSVLILSGSNMSGKSTLLRAIGINILLAKAGAPVAADRMRLSWFELVTSIRVVDSLARGTSHFYAELQRIREALQAADEQRSRLLYLLDEMLHGTNSKERYIGAVSVIRWMSEKGAIGVVTTHDLSVAKVEQELPTGRVTNRHFGDQVVGSEIKFDYLLKDGPVQTTNALRLMKAIGIDIELSAPQ